MPEIDSMGKLNDCWGICGFTSSLYALYQKNPSTSLATSALSATRMLAEIKTFLKLLEADGSPISGKIEAFTRTFPGYEHFTIKNYVETINGTPGLFVKNEALDPQVLANPAYAKYFSIALPPEAVVDYLKRVCGFKNPQIVGPGSGKSELILGVKKPGETDAFGCGGLCHWVYQNNGKIYSWGNQYDSLADADAAYAVAWEVSPSG